MNHGKCISIECVIAAALTDYTLWWLWILSLRRYFHLTTKNISCSVPVKLHTADMSRLLAHHYSLFTISKVAFEKEIRETES